MNKKTALLRLLMLTSIVIILLSAKSFEMNYANSTTDNTLTAKEKAAGWKLLFDGKTLQGWHAYQNKPSNTWKAENGELISTGDNSDTSKHADIVTDDQFENFELSVDWKVPPIGNSGIMYLVSEQYDQAFLSGPEYQLLDNKGYEGQIEDYQKCGANYGMNAPLKDAAKPVGEWNTTKIIVNKAHVEHWLNGEKVVEYELWTDDWKKHKEEGKWKDAPGYAALKKGHIALQDSHSEHGGVIAFKNIKIKLL